MLGFFFGFNARLGRLQYFLASLGLGVGSAIVATVVVVALAAIPKMPGLVLGGTIVVLIALFLWANVMLQAMRFRDIGWDPVCVIPGWIAAMVLDYVVAGRFPDYALPGSHHGTWVGALINLGLSIAMLFFPSGADDASSGGPSMTRTPPTSGRGSRVPATEARLARITGGDAGRGLY